MCPDTHRAPRGPGLAWNHIQRSTFQQLKVIRKNCNLFVHFSPHLRGSLLVTQSVPSPHSLSSPVTSYPRDFSPTKPQINLLVPQSHLLFCLSSASRLPYVNSPTTTASLDFLSHCYLHPKFYLTQVNLGLSLPARIPTVSFRWVLPSRPPPPESQGGGELGLAKARSSLEGGGPSREEGRGCSAPGQSHPVGCCSPVCGISLCKEASSPLSLCLQAKPGGDSPSAHIFLIFTFNFIFNFSQMRLR